MRIILGLVKAVGIIHFLIVYELAYFWRKTGLRFRDLGEMEEFLETYLLN